MSQTEKKKEPILVVFTQCDLCGQGKSIPYGFGTGMREGDAITQAFGWKGTHRLLHFHRDRLNGGAA